MRPPWPAPSRGGRRFRGTENVGAIYYRLFSPCQEIAWYSEETFRLYREVSFKRYNSFIGSPPPPKLDHAIVASIFSAAAIEAGMNLYISIPILYIKDENIQRFTGVLVTKYLRLPIWKKLKFVCEFCPEIRTDKALLERVRELFEYRNSLLHSSPDYVEPLGLPSDSDDEYFDEEGFRVGKLVRYPSLSLRGISSSEVEEAFQHYQTALDFLTKLPAELKLAEESR